MIAMLITIFSDHFHLARFLDIFVHHTKTKINSSLKRASLFSKYSYTSRRVFDLVYNFSNVTACHPSLPAIFLAASRMLVSSPLIFQSSFNVAHNIIVILSNIVRQYKFL